MVIRGDLFAALFAADLPLVGGYMEDFDPFDGVETPIKVNELRSLRKISRRRMEHWYSTGLSLGEGQRLRLRVYREGRTLWTTMEEYRRFLRKWNGG